MSAEILPPPQEDPSHSFLAQQAQEETPVVVNPLLVPDRPASKDVFTADRAVGGIAPMTEEKDSEDAVPLPYEMETPEAPPTITDIFQRELERPRSRRGVVVALTAGGLAVGTGLAGTAWYLLTHRSEANQQSKVQPTVNTRPAFTPTPAPGETEASPADKAFAERFRQNDPETKKQLLETAWRYESALADESDPAKKVDHLPTGVVDGFVFTAAHPDGERVQNLKINDPDATSKAHLLELHVPFFYTERKVVRVVDEETQTPTEHLALVATIGGYNKVAETLEGCDEGYTEEVIVGWFNPPPATEPDFGINGMSYSATGEVTQDSPDSSAVLPGTTENIEKALDEVKGQMLIVGFVTNIDAEFQYLSDQQKQKYKTDLEVYEAQQPAAIALINQRGEAPFATTAAKTGATVQTGGDPTKFAWAVGIKANHSHF